MQILTIINLPWEPENNTITRSEINHKKKNSITVTTSQKSIAKTYKTYSYPSNLTETA